MAGDAEGNNAWTIDRVEVLDYCRGYIRPMVRRATRAWDVIATGIKLNYEERAYRHCDDIDRRVGAIVVCQKPDADAQQWAQATTEQNHHEIVWARIWIFAGDDPGDIVGYELDFEESIAHEFGHSLGLRHNGRLDDHDQPVSLMHPDMITGSLGPKLDDIIALQRMGYLRASQVASQHRRKHGRRR